MPVVGVLDAWEERALVGLATLVYPDHVPHADLRAGEKLPELPSVAGESLGSHLESGFLPLLRVLRDAGQRGLET